MSTVELRFAALPGHVRTARMIAAAVSRRSGVPEEILDEIKLAVGEACARAVSVNRRFDPQAPVIVRVSDGDGAFTVSVADRGPRERDVPPTRRDVSPLNGRGRADTPGSPDGCRTLTNAASPSPSLSPPTVAGPAAAEPMVTDPLAAQSLAAQPVVAEPMVVSPVASGNGIWRPDEEEPCSPTVPGLGLALIEGLVDDFTITTRTDRTGMIVTMRWATEPLEGKPAAPVMAL
ncbi:hypothetical protein FsymDg_4337 [Candidatus Protofrankia datiscae]|uniref:Histidine kinase/HSP90-like ATPase domain-containing protein n=1 Tax=Candidatus Protofrankia datiscae TaxID=2716812 RepID=F8AYM0_9ACTN|nr:MULTISPECIES: ATP-binding protein [Protofrankia]AEH11590.1 hypothetical protein FsymDg_4337 [Candidatus Protofrankia datiscae]